MTKLVMSCRFRSAGPRVGTILIIILVPRHESKPPRLACRKRAPLNFGVIIARRQPCRSRSAHPGIPRRCGASGNAAAFKNKSSFPRCWQHCPPKRHGAAEIFAALVTLSSSTIGRMFPAERAFRDAASHALRISPASLPALPTPLSSTTCATLALNSYRVAKRIIPLSTDEAINRLPHSVR